MYMQGTGTTLQQTNRAELMRNSDVVSTNTRALGCPAVVF